jgi:hypothetical protein
MKPRSVKDWVDHDFDIMPPTSNDLRLLGKRLLDYQVEDVLLWKRNNVPGPFATDLEYYEKGLDRVNYAIRFYRVEGHENRIGILEEDAEKFERIRAHRLANNIPTRILDHVLPIGLTDLDYALPEDIIAVLDQLANSAYLLGSKGNGRIILFNRENWHDGWNAQQGLGKADAAKLWNGDIVFFVNYNNCVLRFTLSHEFCHYLAERYHDEDTAFYAAVALECPLGIGWVPDPYAIRNGEHPPVFGQELQHFLGERFLRTADGGPIRSYVWLMTLAEMMAAMPIERRPVCYGAYLDRIEYARVVLRKKVDALLTNFKATGTATQLENVAVVERFLAIVDSWNQPSLGACLPAAISALDTGSMISMPELPYGAMADLNKVSPVAPAMAS